MHDRDCLDCERLRGLLQKVTSLGLEAGIALSTVHAHAAQDGEAGRTFTEFQINKALDKSCFQYSGFDTFQIDVKAFRRALGLTGEGG